MAKNIVVFSDGTGQDGGLHPEQRLSNIYKMYRASCICSENKIDPKDQVAFYDPGLGTDASAPGATSIARRIRKLLSSATGLGITTNITDCYEFIINHYQPGDRIFLFGFSRGAYTARCVANVLWLCGVPTKTETGERLPRFRKGMREIANEAVREIYEFGAGRDRAEFQKGRTDKARRFRHRYGSGDELQSNVAPYFIGVFDTVAALGASGVVRWIISTGLLLGAIFSLAAIAGVIAVLTGWSFWKLFFSIAIIGGAYALWKWLLAVVKTNIDPTQGRWESLWQRLWGWHIAQWSARNYDRLLSGHVEYARSANAIDETRADFDRVGWGNTVPPRKTNEGEPEPLIQLWFAGNHSDIGGSYAETESRLSDIALGWMIEQAESLPHPLIIESDRILRFPMPDGLQHCEVSAMRDLIDGMVWKPFRRLARSVGWQENVRSITHDAIIHPTVRQRFELTEVAQCNGFGPYRPAALRDHGDFKHFYSE